MAGLFWASLWDFSLLSPLSFPKLLSPQTSLVCFIVWSSLRPPAPSSNKIPFQNPLSTHGNHYRQLSKRGTLYHQLQPCMKFWSLEPKLKRQQPLSIRRPSFSFSMNGNVLTVPRKSPMPPFLLPIVAAQQNQMSLVATFIRGHNL